MTRRHHRRNVRSVFAASLALSAASLAPISALAATVVLAPKSGGFDIGGELKSFDGTSYVLETSGGIVTLAAAAYDCVGGTCPAGQRPPASTQSGEMATQATFGLHGSVTIGTELMPALIHGFAGKRKQNIGEVFIPLEHQRSYQIYANAQNPSVNIKLHRYGTKTGISSLIAGQTTIAMADRAILPEEIAQLPAPAPGQTARVNTHVLGLDGVGIIVGSGVETTSLTARQISRIFAGEVSDWSEIGLKPGRITAYVPDAGRGGLHIFTEAFLKPFNLAMSPYATRLGTNVDIASAVANNPFSIGLASLAYTRNVRNIAIAQTCGLLARPTRFAVKTEEYKLSRRLYLYTSTTGLDPAAQSLIDFALSTEGQKIVGEQRFIDQNIESASYEEDAERIRSSFQTAAGKPETAVRNQLLADLPGRRRLSVAFRFSSGTSVLDPRARQDIQRLADLMKTPEYQGKQVLLGGFADPLGTFGPNQVLSLRRAEQVRAALMSAGAGSIRADQISVRGYGATAPISCNDTVEGQERNRRVEVWVKD